MAWWRRGGHGDLEGTAGPSEGRKRFDRDELERRDAYLSAFTREAEGVGGAFGARFPRARRRVAAPALVLARRTVVDDISTHAGALTYAALLSIPALLLFSASVVGFVLAGNPSAQRSVIDGLTGIFPGGAASSATEFFTKQLNAAIGGRLSFGLIGLVTLLWTASGIASRLRHALGQIFGTERTGILTGRFVGMVIGVLMILAIFGLAALSVVEGWFSSGTHDTVAQIGAFLAVAVGEFVFFVALYRILTPGGPSWAGHVPGAIVFVICFEALKTLGAFYFSRVVANSTALYGTLGSLFGAMAFVYATTWSLLVSAEISSMVRARRRGPATPG
jgi:YihY family inner membrane protein